MGSIENALNETDKVCKPVPPGTPCEFCQKKTYFIAVGDRSVRGSGGLFYHYSLEYWVVDAAVVLNVQYANDRFESTHEGSKRLAAVQLLADPDHEWESKKIGRDVATSVKVSVIFFDSTSTHIMPIFDGDEATVKSRWDQAVVAAQSYPYAEVSGFGGNFVHWPDSYYHVGNDVNNSNTFVRYLVHAIGLSMMEMSGFHPGRLVPRPDNEKYSKPWIKK